MICPACGLINPDSAQRCDCGYDFAARKIKLSYLSDKQKLIWGSVQFAFY